MWLCPVTMEVTSIVLVLAACRRQSRVASSVFVMSPACLSAMLWRCLSVSGIHNLRQRARRGVFDADMEVVQVSDSDDDRDSGGRGGFDMLAGMGGRGE